jgi:hypothetical protein
MNGKIINAENIQKISAILIVVGSIALPVQAQLIDAFNGENLSAYTTTLILDGSVGAG